MNKLTFSFVTLALAAASAASYDVKITSPVSYGDKKLNTGQYTVEVSGDKAYLSANNFDAVDKVGGQLFAAFKANSTGASGGLFEKAYHWFFTGPGHSLHCGVCVSSVSHPALSSTVSWK